ncbi:MAG: acyl-CoA thioesterase [Gemmatimonadetes bacterium]|nr:acyl-CoA thioesterase [Gemmatimonadota bacterium]
MLSYIDQAGAVAAKRVTDHTIVTVSMKEVIFKKPVYVADLISFYACVTNIGRTSIRVHVWVEAERSKLPRETVPVTEAEVVFVCVDKDGNSIPVES